MKPRICIGTAQFGLPYGITNARGKVPEKEVSEILAKAAQFGINMLDTAQAYGDSQTIIGRNLPLNNSIHIVTKLSAQLRTVFSLQDKSRLDNIFFKSCEELGVDSIDTLLLHSSDDLRKPGSRFLEEWLFSLRDRGLVKRLGVSIYTKEDLRFVNSNLLDLVQLPLSLYDQRLLNDGTIESLVTSGVALHARSVYLQGLLLQPVNKWPDWVANELRDHHNELVRYSLGRGCGLIDLALGFVKEQTNLEAVVIGISSMEELLDLKRAWDSPSLWHNKGWKDWAFNSSLNLDPRNWTI